MSLRNIGFFESDEMPESKALSSDNVFEILSHLKLKDLVNTQHICKKFGDSSRNEQLWRMLFKKHFNVDITGLNSMRKFILHYNCMQAIEYKIPDFKPVTSADSSVELENEAFQKYHQTAEKVKKKFVTSVYKELCAFIDNDKMEQDINWTAYLQSQFLLTHHAYFKNYQHVVKYAKTLILKAMETGHPLAIFEFAQSRFWDNKITKEEKHNWINKLSEYKLPDITFRLVRCFLFDFNQGNSGEFHKNGLELLIQAAKQDHAQAAYVLALCYLKHYDVENSIPFGDNQWECLPLLLEISKLFHDKSPQEQEEKNDFKEKLKQLDRFANQGDAGAASLLEMIFKYGHDGLGIKQNLQKSKFYHHLAKEKWHASIHARKDRAIYWLEQAVEGGVIEAQDLLKKINETNTHDITSIFDYGSRDNSPQNSPESSPQNSPRR